MGALSDFAAKHWVLGGIVASLLWFVGGRQYLSNRQSTAAIGWQCIAVIIALITCGWSVAEKEWLGLVAGIAVVGFEVYSIKRSTLGSQGQ